MGTAEDAEMLVKYYTVNSLTIRGRRILPQTPDGSDMVCDLVQELSSMILSSSLPNSKYTDEEILKFAEPFGKVKKYFLNRIRRECFLEMYNAEDAEKMAADYKAKPPKLNGKRLTIYVSRKYKQLKHGHRTPSTVKRASDDSPQKFSKDAEEPPAKKPKEEAQPEVEEEKKEDEENQKEEEKQQEEEMETPDVSEETAMEEKSAAEKVPEVSAERIGLNNFSPLRRNGRSWWSRWRHRPIRAGRPRLLLLLRANPAWRLCRCHRTTPTRPSVRTFSDRQEVGWFRFKKNKIKSHHHRYGCCFPAGVEHVKAGFYCRICFLFYSNEDTAKKTHCSSQAHYDKRQRRENTRN
uniref:Matrin-type domain-containing protein n=1 Tax=Oreochromis niloticus TaxID=8128 RepID=A0A669DLF6_ORENI